MNSRSPAVPFGCVVTRAIVRAEKRTGILASSNKMPNNPGPLLAKQSFMSLGQIVSRLQTISGRKSTDDFNRAFLV